MGITAGAGLHRHITTRPPLSAWKNLELLLPLLLLIESLIQFLGAPLYHLFYIPVIVIISGYFPLKIVLGCMLAVLIAGIPALDNSFEPFIQPDYELISGVYLAIFITGIISYYISCRKTKTSKKAVEDLEKLKSNALSLEASTESSLFDEDRFSHLVKSILETEKELNSMLNFTRKATNSNSATLFILEGDDLVLKASTEDIRSDPTYAEKGYLSGIIKEKKIIIQPKLKGSFFGLPRTRTDDTGSFLCAPILDGDIPLGALLIDSKDKDAFGSSEKDTAGEFALQLKQILKRTRTYIEVERFTKGFKALHEAGKTLSASLEVGTIAEKFVELVSGMVNSSAVGFFIADKGKLKVIAKRGFEPEKESFYLKGTYFDLIVRNKQNLHFTRLEKKQAVYPFKSADTKTFLGIPIVSEEEVLGVLAVTSKEPDAISSFQTHLMTTIADQAAMFLINAQLHNEVEKLAVTDGLTDLYNHKHFQERLNEEFQRIKRIPQTLSLMLIDIDYFKKINDRYGHPAGDVVLKNLAKILKKTLRGIDIIARYGGEEFAAVLMGSEKSGARKMAERLRTSVMNNPFFIDGNKITITLSIGLAAHPHDAETKDELIEKADQALYHAKESGRNQVCTWKDINK